MGHTFYFAKTERGGMVETACVDSLDHAHPYERASERADPLGLGKRCGAASCGCVKE